MTDQNKPESVFTLAPNDPLIPELQLIQHSYCNCDNCFRARNFIAKSKASEPVTYEYPLLGSIHEACTKLGM